ncbi:MAG: hypothetical protein AAGB51_03335 [Planctomycetota bacterium]
MTIPFSRDGYRRIIEAALLAGYSCRPVRECDEPSDGPSILLRHDVDLSLDCAAELAELESSLGVRSTYFILLYNDLYNPLAPVGRELIERIASLGHEIGLHWDSSLHDASSIETTFPRELEILSEVAGVRVTSASQHIPTDNELMDVSAFVEHECYASDIAQRYTYVSDSAMSWRAKTPLDLIAEGLDVQFLAHPIWWTAPGSTLEAKVNAIGAASGAAFGARFEAFGAYARHCLDNRAALDRSYEQRRSHQGRSAAVGR